MIKETYKLTWREYIFKLISEADMDYNSILFFLFMVLFLTIFFILRGEKLKNAWIMIGSIFFYLYAGISALLVVFGTAMIIYVAALCMDSVYGKFDAESKKLAGKGKIELFSHYKKKTRLVLILAILIILAIWLGVKIGKLLGAEEVGLPGLLHGRGIIVPLGISYYSLSALGYLLDVYWRKTKCEKNFFRLFNAMIYFPHIMMGPISRYNQLIKRMKELPKFDYNRVCFGLQRVLWGYIKKSCIADRLVLFTSTVYATLEEFAGVEILIAVILGVVQLYADFSGCMDIVCGISQVMGIQLDENFNQPFFAKNISEFWRRWHMTLGKWFKDYVYMPLFMAPWFMKRVIVFREKHGRQAGQVFSAAIPRAVVWILTGLWHGTGWDYLIWGIYYGTIISISQATESFWKTIKIKLRVNENKAYHKLWQMFRTSAFFVIGKMFNIAGSLTGCGMLWRQLFREHRIWILFDESLYTHGLDRKDFMVALVGIGLMLAVDILHEKGIRLRATIARQPIPIRWVIYWTAMFILIIFGMYGPGYDASKFVYGAF